jgi:hypothetical protein
MAIIVTYSATVSGRKYRFYVRDEGTDNIKANATVFPSRDAADQDPRVIRLRELWHQTLQFHTVEK